MSGWKIERRAGQLMIYVMDGSRLSRVQAKKEARSKYPRKSRNQH
jgi:hypothetical protein